MNYQFSEIKCILAVRKYKFAEMNYLFLAEMNYQFAGMKYTDIFTIKFRFPVTEIDWLIDYCFTSNK
jgi:hypothetical protein